jgi:hypothetical protein
MTNALMNGLVAWLGDLVTNLLTGLLDLLATNVFASPDVTVFAPVRAIADRAALVVGSVYLLAILAAGIMVMVSSSVQMRYGLKELLPRLVVGFVASAFAVPLCSTLIGVSDAVITAMVGNRALATSAVTTARSHVVSAILNGASPIVAVIIGLLIVVLLFTLLGGFLVRVAVLVVLAGVAPVALACYALPYTQPVAQLWWRSLLGCLAIPTLQAITFSTGVDLLISPGANLPTALGLPGSDVVTLLLVVVVLWTTLKIPGLVRRYVTRQSAGSAGLVRRSVAMSTIVRRLGRI